MDTNRTNMKNKMTSHALALVAAALLSTSVSVGAADAKLDGIAAIVNQDVILVSEVDQLARRIKAGGNANQGAPLFKQALDRLVLEKLQLQSAKRSGIKADEASIDRAMANVAQRNNLQSSQLKQALAKEGIDYTGFRKNLANQLIINSLKRRESSKRAQVSDQEIDDLIASESQQLAEGRSYHVQDLMIASPQPASIGTYEQARRSATQLRKLAITSPDFMKTSYAGNTASDLGWKNATEFSYAYLKELNTLAPGQVSDVVHDARGFHVLKLVEKRGGIDAKSQQVRVRHILIAATDPDAKSKADKIRLQLLQGGDFATLARTNSADKPSALNNGDLGWSDSKRYVPAFAKAAETLALNTISPLIQTKFGYHIMEVLERREVDASKAALQTQARKAILSKKQEQDYEAWLQNLRSNAFIEYRVK